MSRDRSFWVYILASRIGVTLYSGVTNNLVRRVYVHRTDVVSGCTQKYQVHRLVFYEQFSDIENAIRREKRLQKKWVTGLEDPAHRALESELGRPLSFDRDP